MNDLISGSWAKFMYGRVQISSLDFGTNMVLNAIWFAANVNLNANWWSSLDYNLQFQISILTPW